jgi:hypothetical protein
MQRRNDSGLLLYGEMKSGAKRGWNFKKVFQEVDYDKMKAQG